MFLEVIHWFLQTAKGVPGHLKKKGLNILTLYTKNKQNTSNSSLKKLLKIGFAFIFHN